MKIKKTYSEKLMRLFLDEFKFYKNNIRYKVYEAFILPLYGYKSFSVNNQILTDLFIECENDHIARIQSSFKELLDRLDFLEKENKKLINVIIKQRQLLNK